MREHNSGKPTREQITTLLNRALDQLYEKDGYLIDNEPYLKQTDGFHHVGERSIVFRLAHYMQNIMDNNPVFKNLVLDCEYNRNGVRAKTLPSFPDGVYPDVIIHNRGTNNRNLLVMEVKSYWNTDNTHDIRKIREFIDANGDYHFSFGVSLVIERHRKDVKMNIFCSNNSDLWG